MDKQFSQNNFDLLRLFGAIQVLIVHSTNHFHLTRPGWFFLFGSLSGVPMFFTISGFLISASFERNGSLINYFRNRCFRIYPGLWSCILLNVIVITIFGHIGFFNLQALQWFFCQLAGIIYTPGFLRGYGTGSYDGSLWTIPIELQFYIVLPIIYLIFRKITKNNKTQNILFGCICLFFMVIAFILIHRNLLPINMDLGQSGIATKILRASFLPYVYMFLFGIFLQRVKAQKFNFIAGKGWLWLPVFLILIKLVPVTALTHVIAMLLLGVTVISLAYTRPDFGKKLLKGNDISYGVYIYHGIIINILIEEYKVYHIYDLFVVMVATIIIATLSWNFIEKPILRRKKQTLNIALANTL